MPTRDLVSSLFHGVTENPDQVLAITAVNLGIDAGASAAVGVSRAAFGVIADQLPDLFPAKLDSNHVVYELVHEASWEAFRIVLTEIHQDHSNEFRFGDTERFPKFATFRNIADAQVKAKLNKNLDPRHAQSLAPRSGFRHWLSGFFPRLVDQVSAKDLETYKASVVKLVQRLEVLVSRESQNQADPVGPNQLIDLETQALTLMLDTVYRIHRRVYHDGHRFEEDRQTDPFIDHMMNCLFDCNRGWGPTFRCYLKEQLRKPKNQGINAQIQLNLSGETRQLAGETHTVSLEARDIAQGLQLRMDAIQSTLASMRSAVDRIEVYVAPALRLDHEGVDPLTGPQRFVDYGFRAKNTGFVGREDEFKQLEAFLTNGGDLRWWQVNGEGGQGKSRLALELVDRAHSRGWYAGFLQAADMQELDWAKLPIDRPTLCVVDYVAAPQKAQQVAQGLATLARRLNPNQVGWQKGTFEKFRLLIVERSGFDFDQEQSAGRALWFDTFLQQGQRSLMTDTAHARASLTLNPLSTDAMKDIVRSWRESQGSTNLTDSQLESVIDWLGPPTDERPLGGRAWRPLFAMAMADQYTESGQAQFGLPGMAAAILEEEATRHWVDAEGKPVDPTETAKRIALLATILGQLDRDQLTDSGLFDDATSDDWIMAHMVAGYRIAQNRVAREWPTLPARTPDLLGEFMVAQLTEGLPQEQVESLVQMAWSTDPTATIAFLMRMSEDRTDLAIQSVFDQLSAIEPNSSDLDAGDAVAERASYYGLLGLLKTAFSDRYDQSVFSSEWTLLIASAGGHVPVVEQLLALPGIQVNQDDERNGNFPLLLASQNGHAAVVEQLLAQPHIEVNQDNEKNGTFPLLMASQNGHAAVVEQLLAHPHIEVNKAVKEDGPFPLLMASKSGHAAVVEQLLSQPGIKVNQTVKEDGAFPLLLASQNDHAAVVELLLAQPGVKVNKDNEKNGTFPLLMASQEGHAAVVERLLYQPGIKVNKENEKNGVFPLLMASQEGHTAVVEQLLAQPDIEVNKDDGKDGTFPLFMAAGGDHPAVVEQLLQADPPADIHKVWENESVNTLELVLGLHEETSDADTKKSRRAMILLLLKHGALLQNGTRPQFPE